jgi:hypothetical protein
MTMSVLRPFAGIRRATPTLAIAIAGFAFVLASVGGCAI